MTVVTFLDYTPMPRYDSVPWSAAVISEGVTSDGPWLPIETISFAGDLDADPSNPKPRSFTTDNATLPSGWYTVTFRDATGATQQPTNSVFNGEQSGSDYRPSADRVARKLLSRTRDAYGNLQGRFSTTTTPTSTQVDEIISDTMTDVADLIGDDIPEALFDDAADLVATRAAMAVELAFFSDQVNTGRSIYPQLEKEYEMEIPRLQKAVTEAEEGDGTVDDAGASNRAQGAFPDASNSIGFKTRW